MDNLETQPMSTVESSMRASVHAASIKDDEAGDKSRPPSPPPPDVGSGKELPTETSIKNTEAWEDTRICNSKGN